MGINMDGALRVGCLNGEEIEDALKSAGFSRIRSDHHKSKPWITVIAKKVKYSNDY